MVFALFDPVGREQRKKVRFDRKYLAARSRRFLKNYLNANEAQKFGYYRVVGDVSEQCHPASALSSPEINDAEIAEATSNAAMKIVLERIRLRKADRQNEFFTDAYATVAVAYHRAAGIYSEDRTMRRLGTAAVHLVTMATSYTTIEQETHHRKASIQSSLP